MLGVINAAGSLRQLMNGCQEKERGTATSTEVLARGDGTATSAVGLVRELGTATSAEDWERGRGTKISQVRFISTLINLNSHLSFI